MFEQISILVKIFENLDFLRKFRKHFFFVKFSKISSSVRTFGKFRKFRKISILVKFSKNFDFGQNFRKFGIFFGNFEKFVFL